MKTRITPPSALVRQLDDILLEITWSKIAKRAFPAQTVGWFYDKLHGRANVGEFTSDEKKRIKDALIELSERIRSSAELIEI
ncbi:MAG: hypothetical protein FWE30_03020 [Bacteroidales bacterium]|nr:hypothetical protein [Bacteroidales bacterium]MCL2738400.1 hypothetical protein [Bacteroidales bacterium]